MRWRLASFLLASLTLPAAASADTAYMEPSTYAPGPGQTLTVEASFSDHCCNPKHAVRSEAYAVILPDGSSMPPDRIEHFATHTAMEHKLTEPGTTRFTTGERLGRMGEYVLLDATYHLINSEDAAPVGLPPGIAILSSQTATVSDTYVTVGQPTWDSVNTPVGRLAITPGAHPSAIHAGDRLSLSVTFDGEPVTAQIVTLTRSGQGDRPRDTGLTYQTDANGEVTIALPDTGTHLVMTRLQAPSPSGAQTDLRSYTTSLTFQVQDARAPGPEN
ncbi:DUF4198 domain-containing protein [Hyphomonas sp.]|uniref:DUF4198 domain-containing protein n=1 Tax=Hyphomonas sp. TaxID=87 RepID=UPI00356B2958